MKIIDASNTVYGRLSTVVAKDLLNGETITIVNADKCVITGSRKYQVKRFLERRDIGSVRKGPYYPRTPHMILRRSIKNMLPSKTSHGKEALKRCHVYSGVPKEFKDKDIVRIEKADNHKVSDYVTLAEISMQLGYKVKS